jgi:hypothetical protein
MWEDIPELYAFDKGHITRETPIAVVFLLQLPGTISVVGF